MTARHTVSAMPRALPSSISVRLANTFLESRLDLVASGAELEQRMMTLEVSTIDHYGLVPIQQLAVFALKVTPWFCLGSLQ